MASTVEADLAFMELALEQAKFALDNLEVPIGCVIVEDGKVIASGRNRTTETRNATRHAEMEAIDVLLKHWQKIGLNKLQVAEIFSRCVLYVTCEPCIMCATALSILGIREAYFGCANDKFGGCGSILSLHEIDAEKSRFAYAGGLYKERVSNVREDLCQRRQFLSYEVSMIREIPMLRNLTDQSESLSDDKRLQMLLPLLQFYQTNLFQANS